MTIQRLMIVVAAIALDCAGFVGSFGQNIDWGIFVLLAATAGLLATAILGVVLRRGAERATWLGVAVFGWVFILLASALAVDRNPWTRAGMILGAQPVALIGGGIGRLMAPRPG